MLKICVDTSFLITFADPSRPNHSFAVDYFRHCVGNGHMLCLSTLVVAEFECGQPITDLPLGNFHILPFNFRHAVESANYHRQIKGTEPVDEANRYVVRNDLKILAQAHIEQCSIIITEDANTLTRWAERLRGSDQCRVSSILLKDGFRPDELKDPDQKTLGI
jgi:predicted nucleic acid-binding protein